VTVRSRLLEINRILVALDASPASLAALEVAADLAVRHQAELVGIFVEDINLIRMAEIPFAFEIGFYSRSPRRIDTQLIERQLRAHRRWVESILRTIAVAKNLHWTFLSTRGDISQELILAAKDSDLILLGSSGWSGRRRMGSTARNMVIQSPIQAMILHRRLESGAPILLIYDGSEPSNRALTAASLVGNSYTSIIVLLLAEDPERARELTNQIELDEIDQQHLTYHWIPYLDSDKLAQYVRNERCGVVILPAESKYFDTQSITPVLIESDCAFILVR
jgi:nucleotide-binding universal stress UspA family protein